MRASHETRPTHWWMIGVITVAAYLRFFRINDLTEFLGDQGRTLLVLRAWVHDGIVPMSGPTTLSGAHLGPFYYYLLLPGYLTTGTPLGVALWVAFLGVVSVFLLYKAVLLVYGRTPAIAVSALYAVAPAIVIQDRTLWEPNLVPLFAILFAYLSILQHYRVSLRTVFAQGVVCSILIQLHYPNVFFIVLLALVSFGHSIRVKEWKFTLLATVIWSGGFLLAILPFLFYEMSHEFADVGNIAHIFLNSGSGVGKRDVMIHALDYAVRVIGKALPNMSTSLVLILGASWTIFLVARFTSWNMFWSFWLVFGLLGMARFNGVVYDHYLNFLIPVPFFMIASVLSVIRNNLLKTIALASVFIVIGLQVLHSDIFRKRTSDITRVSSTVRAIRDDASGQPFSFTLIAGPSFSDLHYRYFFRTVGREPIPIRSRQFSLLYLVCDQQDACPNVKELVSQKEIHVLCYDEHCNQQYPVLTLANAWSYVKDMMIPSQGKPISRIYVFRRL